MRQHDFVRLLLTFSAALAALTGIALAKDSDASIALFLSSVVALCAAIIAARTTTNDGEPR